MLYRTLTVGNLLRDLGEFYYPHKMDFRGRIYPVPYWVHPQGPDISRSLLRFKHGSPLTREGFDALMVYGANLWGEKGTRDARRFWGRKFFEDSAYAVYQDPIENSEWHEADDPFQFLAWCLELGELADSGWPDKPFISRLPVHVDAKNNGLQLFALMSGDRTLAELTSAISPTQAGHFPDIYSIIGEVVSERVRAVGDSDILGLWKRVFGDAGVPRSWCKRPVMTLPYGVTLFSAQGYVQEAYLEEYGREGPFKMDYRKPCRALANVIMQEVTRMCSGAVSCMSWLQECCAAVSETGSVLRWDTPLGWPVYQDYRKNKKNHIFVALSGKIRNLTIRSKKADPDPRGARQGVSPNFVHSIDASILARVASGWHGPLAAIHDSFGTTASEVPALHKALREAVTELTLRKDPLSLFKSQLESYYRVDLPDPPRLGRIEEHEVMQSQELFS